LLDVIILRFALVTVGAVPRFVCEFRESDRLFSALSLSQADIRAIAGGVAIWGRSKTQGTRVGYPGAIDRLLVNARCSPSLDCSREKLEPWPPF
jgi:hypothetical protein